MGRKPQSLSGPFFFPWASNRGSILVVSLWMITVISVFAFTAGFNARQKISFADRIDRRNSLDGLAETGVYKALLGIKQKKEATLEYHTLNDPYTNQKAAFMNVPLGSDATFTVSYEYIDADEDAPKVRYGVQDEAQKINLNTSKPKYMSQLFQIVAEVEEDDADDIAYSIADWKDSNSSLAHPDYGAENDYYEDLEQPYLCKDHDFESVDELLLVKGMTRNLFEKIKPYVTVFGSGAVNVNTAPRAVLLALGMRNSLIQNIDSFRSGPDREEGTDDDRAFINVANMADQLNQVYSISSEDVSVISQLVADNLLTVTSEFFMIRSHGEIRQKAQTLEVVAVSDINGKIVYWQSSGVPRRMTTAELKRARGE